MHPSFNAPFERGYVSEFLISKWVKGDYLMRVRRLNSETWKILSFQDFPLVKL